LYLGYGTLTTVIFFLLVGREMCFSPPKFLSLITVTGGVGAFGVITERLHAGRGGYSTIGDDYEDDDDASDGAASVVLTGIPSSIAVSPDDKSLGL